ncbi:ATP synthase F1 subunit gamma [Sandaracinomonas limnophila]|jgi:F-type H+-transporting ATPase subunit gamma|uniref:ATP synthase gamma chain n=1 Tax=Sandaracinomonas limnophila TaxID=1862386 RepID=A0A437PXS5_9BACT|nr:ATP synthase F1 subunit gamma [Sandaracinomonas limnophila]RVU27074.1 ATP synthase F1 subunit gamma [Sandaracinomonas limnophila]
MASLKEVRNRITSVNSTQQITKAMKMVSAAKLRRATDAIVQMRPYAQKLTEMISTVSSKTEAGKENPFTEAREVKNVLIVSITSDRGLCGAFNANIGKATIALIQEKYEAQNQAGNVTILTLGKKGAEYLGRRGYKIDGTHTEIFSKLNFTNVRSIGEEVLNAFASQQYDVVEVVFNEFKNVATQIIRTEQLLPLAEKDSDASTASSVDYIFEPNEAEIINELIPKSVKLSLFKSLLESNASEHGARMTAMDKATDNAGELLKALKLEYNRSRQAAITKEILEIVGGAEALNN